MKYGDGQEEDREVGGDFQLLPPLVEKREHVWFGCAESEWLERTGRPWNT
jgi:hypothetical protein